MLFNSYKLDKLCDTWILLLPWAQQKEIPTYTFKQKLLFFLNTRLLSQEHCEKNKNLILIRFLWSIFCLSPTGPVRYIELGGGESYI